MNPYSLFVYIKYNGDESPKDRGSEYRFLSEGQDIVRRKEQSLVFCTFGAPRRRGVSGVFVHVIGSVFIGYVIIKLLVLTIQRKNI